MERLDPVLIYLYQITGYPLADYFMGTLLLAFLSVLIGELTISLVFRVNRKHIETLNDKVDRMNSLSQEALRLGDEKSYRAVNKVGNETFGHLFFNKFGLSAAALWPIFIALGWMQGRFADIYLPLPFLGWGLNYLALFLLYYIIARILFSRVKPILPYFRSVHQILLTYDRRNGEKNPI
ncbi:MAG TPA: hypothetical protein VK564_01075 [Thermodesulfobacteriota bacterium]|nr:hypothetical protein [Thermodesulfobacteriota bacterium]